MKSLLKNGFVPRLITHNDKLGKMLICNTYAGDTKIKVEFNSTEYACNGTCKGCCKTCKNDCYALRDYNRREPKASQEGYTTGGPRKNNALTTIAMHEDIDKVFTAYQTRIDRARSNYRFLRVHAAGEFTTSNKELAKWIELAQNNPRLTIYTYTKRQQAINYLLAQTELPSNFIINISVWHRYGISNFKCLSAKHPKNTQAFVVLDGFDYSRYNMEVNAVCPAYTPKGRRNKQVPTCDKCGLCMRGNSLVIGCYLH